MDADKSNTFETVLFVKDQIVVGFRENGATELQRGANRFSQSDKNDRN
jgi:hypothetical protein